MSTIVVLINISAAFPGKLLALLLAEPIALRIKNFLQVQVCVWTTGAQ